MEKRIPTLDGVRALAVTMVIAGHFGFLDLGGLGVTIFFVLSGFLITTLLIREWDETGRISLRDFYARRSLRIFPAYYVFLAFSLFVDLHQGDTRIEPVIVPAALYYLDYFHAVHGHSSASIAHAWSLAIEEQFYLLWPIAFVLISRWQRERMPQILIAVIGAVMVWRCLAYTVFGLGQSWAYDAFDCRFDALATGCLLAVILRRDSVANRLKAISLQNWSILATVPVILVLELIDGGRFRYLAGFTIEAALIAFVMAQLVCNPSTWPARILETVPLRFLGKISYGMYLYHQWGLSVGRHLTHSHGLLGLAAGYAATIGFALVSWHVVERGLLKFKKRFEVKPGALQPIARNDQRALSA